MTQLMSDIIPETSHEALEIIKDIEGKIKTLDNVEISTDHVVHEGIYTRTIRIPEGVVLSGGLIKVPTTLTINGNCYVMIGDGEAVNIVGHLVLPTAANRKQVFIALEDTYVSMSFKTGLKDIREIEKEFTDEYEALLSNSHSNTIIITGD